MTPPAEICPANAETWTAFEKLVASITARPVRYGPGRGIWDGDRFLVTYAPGRKSYGTNDLKLWPNVRGALYPSLHCTSWTNLFLGWLLRRNADYTHAGNIPDIDKLVTATPDVHPSPGAGPYRGYGDACYSIKPDGTGAKRSGVPASLDMTEILARARAGNWPTFSVFGQSTKRGGSWNWWHHTGVLAVRDGKLYRIAADGYKGAGGYSGDAMRYVEVTDGKPYAAAVYRTWGVGTLDGTYGDQSRPVAAVWFE